MYQKGEYIICGSNGICLVQDITTLSIPGVNHDRKYYLLKPVFSSGSTVYIPTDSTDTTLRPALSRAEAEALIASIPDIPLIPLTDEKYIERTYREYMHENRCESLIRLIKTIYLRKEKRLKKGAKVTAVDSKYFKLAEDSLYNELSVALDIPRTEVCDYIKNCIDNAEE